MISCIILAGGSGTRLWPLSNEMYPKQFLSLFSDNSMIVDTSNRVKNLIPVDNQYVLTGRNYRGLVEQQFNNKINLLVEPIAKNTAPCILWASLKIRKTFGGNTIMVVLPSDHVIEEEDKFLHALENAINEAKTGKILTFGILPTRPETGFGYIEIEQTQYRVNESVKKIVAFREKPEENTAKKYLERGNYLWNSGMFVFCIDVIIQELKNYCPEVYNCFVGIDPDNAVEVKEAFRKAPSISIDYAVMEHTKAGFCIPSGFGWNDVGSFQSLYEVHKKDADGNVCAGNVIARNAKNCYINGQKRIVCIGIDNLVVVEGTDAILVAKKSEASKVGEIVKKIKASE